MNSWSGSGAQARGGESPREGGWGIVVVVSAHLTLAVCMALMRIGGVLYLSWKEDFETNDKETAAVQSILTSTSCFSGLLAGIVTKRFGCRISGMLRGILVFLGPFCSYWVTNIYQLYITVFTVGTEMGFSYNSAVVVVAMYFKRKYNLAIGLAVSGNGTGTMAGPPLLQVLLENFGWRGAFLVASGIAANNVPLGALFRPTQATRKSVGNRHSERQHLAIEETGDMSKGQNGDGNSRHCDDPLHPEPMGPPEERGTSANSRTGYASLTLATKSSKLLERLAFALGLHLLVKGYRYAMLCILHLEFMISYMACALYLIPYAQSVGVAPSSAAFLLSIFGIGSLLGRLGTGPLVSWRISAEHVTAISLGLAGGSVLLLNFQSYPVLAIASFLHGFVSGFVLVVMVVLIRQYVGLRNLAIGSGLGQVFLGCGALTGPLLSGWILDLTHDSFQTVFYVGSAMYFICAVQMGIVPLLKRVEPGIDNNSTDV